jgi:hypothetical protein|tara:strand:- start:252 stop:464 length:213 start_codon:yes stop_codon:yes gene_type:complete
MVITTNKYNFCNFELSEGCYACEYTQGAVTAYCMEQCGTADCEVKVVSFSSINDDYNAVVNRRYHPNKLK